jgi:peptide/nickel transport system substrate-binding protein
MVAMVQTAQPFSADHRCRRPRSHSAARRFLAEREAHNRAEAAGGRSRSRSTAVPSCRGRSGGTAVPLGQMATREVFGYAPDIVPPEPAPVLARRLLAEAGYPQGLDFDLQIPTGARETIDDVVRQLAAVGFRARLVERPIEQFASDVDATFASWFCLSGEASDFFEALAHSPTPRSGYGTGNVLGYRNLELDTLVEKAEAIFDPLTRRRELERAMRLLVGDFGFVPLYSDPLLYGVRRDIAWQPRGDGIIRINDIQRRTSAVYRSEVK